MPAVKKSAAQKKKYPSSGKAFMKAGGKGDYEVAPPKKRYVRRKKPEMSMGRQIGGFLGDAAQKVIKYATGIGDYKVSKNSFLYESNGPPIVKNSGKEFRIRHREYIGEVYSGAGSANTPSPFNVTAYAIQPGLFTTFPWLCQVANQFEQYSIEGMLFEFKSNYSDAVVTANGSLGSVILATNYNASESVFINKIEMENSEFAQSAKPSECIVHPIECAPHQTPLTELYIRATGLVANQDIKTYDLGNFQVATQGIPLAGTNGAAIDLGELWVSYDMVFFKPYLTPYASGGFGHLTWTATVQQFTAASFLPFTNNQSTPLVPLSNINFTITSGNSLNIPLVNEPVQYMIDVIWGDQTSGVGASGWDAAQVLSITNGTLVQQPGASTLGTGIPHNASNVNGATTQVAVQCPQATAAGQFCNIIFNSFSTNTSPTTDVIRIDVFVFAVPYGST